MSGTLDPTTFFVTDIEADGPDSARNSMLSFATVAVRIDRGICGTFEAVLTPRADRVPDPRTTAWWASQPEAHAAATRDPRPPDQGLGEFARWVRGYAAPRAFAARPLMFDGPWIDIYLQEYASERLLAPLDANSLFQGSGVDLATMSGALLALPYAAWQTMKLPAAWYGSVPHTHKAIDDALGYANLLLSLLKLGGAQAGAHLDPQEPRS